jgi:hypothetical protein
MPGNGVELATAYVSLVAASGSLARSVAQEANSPATVGAARRGGGVIGRALGRDTGAHIAPAVQGGLAKGAAAGDREGKKAGKKFGGGFAASMGPVAAAVGAAFAVDFLSGAVSNASDLQEAGTKVNAIFGKEGAAALDKFSDKGAKALGQTKLQVLDAASTFGTFGKSAGLSGKDLAGFASQFTTLSTDFASFYNSSPEEAVEAIGAALRGEAEPIRKYGILLDDATLRNSAMRLGLIKTTKEALTPQQKVLAAQAEIMRQSKDAQGDFARTSGGLANQQRILAAEFEGVKTKIGQALLPAVTAVVSFFANNLGPAVEAVGGFFSTVWDTVTGGSEEASGAIGGFTSFFNTAFTTVKDFIVREVVPRVMSIAAAIQGFVDVARPIVQEFVTGMIARITPLMPTVRQIFGTIGQIITGALELIRAVISRVTTVIAYVWTRWGTDIMNFIRDVWVKILGIIQPAFEGIRGLFETFTKLFKGDWSGAWESLKGVFSSAWKVVTGAIDLALSLLGTGLRLAWEGIISVAGTVWGGLLGAISGPIDRVKQFIQENLIDKVNGLFAFLNLDLKITPIWKPSNVGTGMSNAGRLGTQRKLGSRGYAEGGFTGMIDPREVAGVVHGQEWVIPAGSTRKLLRDAPGLLEALTGYAAGGYVWPVNKRPSFPWGRYPSGGVHRAYDLAVPTGTPVRNPYAGTVIRDGWDGTGYGVHARIAHDDGRGYSILGHMLREVVSVGQRLGQGALIGYSGNTGRSSGPHVHWAVRGNPYSDASAFDPMKGGGGGFFGDFLADRIKNGIGNLAGGVLGGLRKLGPFGEFMAGIAQKLLGGLTTRALSLLGMDSGGPRLAQYDNGGILRPGWTMAYNGLGHDEYVSTSKPSSGGFTDAQVEALCAAFYRAGRDGVGVGMSALAREAQSDSRAHYGTRVG